MRLNCDCRKGARCQPCIKKDTPQVFQLPVVKPDLCVCGPVTRAQGVCECGT